MRALLSAISLGLVGVMIIPATLMVSKLTDAQLDRLIRTGTFFCGGILGILALVGVVAFLAWRDERRRNAALGPVVDAQGWRPMQAHYTPMQQAQLPPPAQWSFGGQGQPDYDLMPEADGRYKFRGK